VLDAPIADGLVVAMAVPTTSNMCVALTTAAGGDSATAVLNAVLGNLLGVVLTPFLLSKLLSEGLGGEGTNTNLALTTTLKRLLRKVRTSVYYRSCVFISMPPTIFQQVVTPIGVGMVVGSVPAVSLWRSAKASRRKLLTRITEVLLLTTVYATFCETISSGVMVSISKPFPGDSLALLIKLSGGIER